jgi:hypothetical protein
MVTELSVWRPSLGTRFSKDVDSIDITPRASREAGSVGIVARRIIGHCIGDAGQRDFSMRGLSETQNRRFISSVASDDDPSYMEKLKKWSRNSGTTQIPSYFVVIIVFGSRVRQQYNSQLQVTHFSRAKMLSGTVWSNEILLIMQNQQSSTDFNQLNKALDVFPPVSTCRRRWALMLLHIVGNMPSLRFFGLILFPRRRCRRICIAVVNAIPYLLRLLG